MLKKKMAAFLHNLIRISETGSAIRTDAAPKRRKNVWCPLDRTLSSLNDLEGA